MANSKVIEMKPSKNGMANAGAKTVMAPKESLTYKNCEKLHADFTEFMNQNKTEVILDCKAISFMDSQALELLLQMNEELRKRGGILKLARLNAVCRDILIATRLLNTLHVYKDMNEAIRGRR
ncbi:MAG: STAS domain-containing protein [Deltaproteobacteria bacterium]|nr:STAS domain-containing protein [Deltaproteobacteria bacterium]